MPGAADLRRAVGPRRVAYVAQHPWVMNATLRANILFSEALDEARYEQTLAQCALSAQLPKASMDQILELKAYADLLFHPRGMLPTICQTSQKPR